MNDGNELRKMNDLDLIYRKKKKRDKMGLKAKAKEIIIIITIISGQILGSTIGSLPDITSLLNIFHFPGV